MPGERPPVPNPGYDMEAGEQALVPPVEGWSVEDPFKASETPMAKIRLVLDRIEGAFSNLTSKERLDAVSRVMEHSLSDGLDLIRRVHKKYGSEVDTGPPLIAVLKKGRSGDVPQNRIVPKHRRVFVIVQERLKQLKQSGDAHVDARRLENVEQFVSDELSGIESRAEERKTSERAKAMLADIDAAYAELVRLKPPQRLRLKEGPKQESDPALAAIEDAAHFAARISETLEGRYETEGVHRIFLKRLEEAGATAERIVRWEETFRWYTENATIKNAAIPMLTENDMSALTGIIYDSAPRLTIYGDLPWKEVLAKLHEDVAPARLKMPAELFYMERRMQLKKLEEATRELEARKRPRVLIESHEGPKEGWDRMTVDGSGSVTFLKEKEGGTYLRNPRLYGKDGRQLKTPDISGAILYPAKDRTWIYGYHGDADDKVVFSIRPDGTAADALSVKNKKELYGLHVDSGDVVEDDFRLLLDESNLKYQDGLRRFGVFSAKKGRFIEIPGKFSHLSKTTLIDGKLVYQTIPSPGKDLYFDPESEGFINTPLGIPSSSLRGVIDTPNGPYTAYFHYASLHLLGPNGELVSDDILSEIAVHGSRIAIEVPTEDPDSEYDSSRFLDQSGRQVIEGSFPREQMSRVFFFGDEIRVLRKMPTEEGATLQILREGQPPIETGIHIPDIENARFYCTNDMPFLLFTESGTSLDDKEDEGRHVTIVGPDGQIAFSGAAVGLPTVTDFGLIIRPADAPGTVRVIRAIPGNTSPEAEAKLANAKEAKRILEELDETGLRNLADLWRKSRFDQKDKWKEKPIFPLHPAAGQTLGRMAQEAPELYLKSSPAVPDDDPEFLAERLVETLFPTPPAPPPPPPDIPKTSGARRILEGVLGIFRPGSGKAIAESSASVEVPRTTKAAAYLTPKSAAEMAGKSGRKEKGTAETVVECREPFVGFVANRLGGAYDRQADRWTTIPRPDRSHAPAHRVLTWAIPLTEWQPSIVLPMPPDAQILPERIIAQVGKRQIPITKIGPGDTVELPPGTERVLYSFALPEPEPMADMDDAAFTQWKRRYVAEHAEAAALQDVPGKIPPAISWLLQSPEFKKLPPKEKVKRIEAYVREISTYDTRNDEVSRRKEGVPLERQWAVAMERAKALNPEKPFAGVCADTAKLACALLRSAGFLAGVQQGFAAKGKRMTTEDAHATAFVLWPDSEGKARIVAVDGTPSSNDPQAAEHPLPQIPDREVQEIASAKETEKAFAQTVFAETKSALQAGNPEALKELRNGKLEAALNAILAHEVRPSDLASVQALFSALRYSPLGQLDIADQAQRNHLQEELVETLDRQRRFKDDAPKTNRPGRALFEEIRRFVAWTAKDPRFAAPGTSLAHVEQIVALAKTGFNATERRALAASLLYLKAERMAGEKG